MDGLDRLDWRKIVGVFVATNAVLAALVRRAAAEASREAYERTHVRWTDANRWEK